MQVQRAYKGSDPTHDFWQKLKVEAEFKALVDLVFDEHRISDISGEKNERKSGTDFILTPRNCDGTVGQPIRCENKFEQHVTGRQLLEWISVDRPSITAGWMGTSRAAWLLSWYLSGEILVAPLDDIRRLILKDPARHKATTARNRTYLSWSTLEDVHYMLRNLENARIIDAHWETNYPLFDKPKMFKGKELEKRCTASEVVELMRTLPGESTPLQLSRSDLIEIAKQLAPANFKREAHADMLQGLPWLD